MEVPREDKVEICQEALAPMNIYGPNSEFNQDNSIPLHRDSTIAMANIAVETLRDSMSLMNEIEKPTC